MVDAPFPPTCAEHVNAYDKAEVVQGYLAFDAQDPMPGSNHSPAYRWGWQNRFRDHQRDDDGYDAVRRAYLRERHA